MELSGRISENLQAAIASSRRLQGCPVHADTLQFWSSLLAFAKQRQDLRTRRDYEDNAALIVQLEAELSKRDEPQTMDDVGSAETAYAGAARAA